MKKLVFWQNCISIHQGPLLRALSATPGVEVTVVADEDIPLERRSMGWEGADYGSCEVIVRPTAQERKLTLDSLRNADAHLFSGLGSYEGPSSAYRDLVQRPHGHVSIITESWDPRGFTAALRTLRYRMRVAKEAAAIDSVLAIGGLARQQFQKAGIPARKLWPFGYFVEESGATPISAKDQTFRVLFVGTMSALKQPRLLLQALAQMPAGDWHLHYLGEGPEVSKVRASAERAGLAERVSFSAFGSNDGVRQEMAESDLVVLPSSYDGWGVVVNEALQTGTRVAVSRSAGASELVRSELQGFTFSGKSASELTEVVAKAMEQGPGDRDELMRWSDTAISPTAGADYLLGIVGGRRNNDPEWGAPWLQNH